MTLQATIDQLRDLKLSGMVAGLDHQLSQVAYADSRSNNDWGIWSMPKPAIEAANASSDC